MVAGDRDTGRVDLRVAGVAEVGTLAVGPPGRRDIGAHGVGRKEEDVAIATTGQDDRVGDVRLDLAGDQVTRNNAASASAGDDQLEHLVADELLHGASGHLTFQRLVGADEQLLTGLATRVERAGHLHATE